MIKYILIVLLLLSKQFIYCQIDGDNIFDKNQVINIELNFSQTNYWDSLVNNYNASQYMKVDLLITDSTGTTSFNDVGIRLKGNSSYMHPGNKKSFKIDFNKYISGQNYDGLKKLNFSNGFKDPSLMREKLFFDFCKVVDVPAPRANFANVYFNGTLWGFYTVIEQIDDQFLDWNILDDEGNLFKAGDNFGGSPNGGGNEADLKYYGNNQTNYYDLYELKSNKDTNDWTDFIQLIDFINNSTNTVFENELPIHIELEQYLRSVALDNLFSNLDTYTESARNYYLYHNLTSNKWEWIKWDANETFGTYGGQTVSNMTTMAIDFHSNNRPLLERIFDSPIIFDQYRAQICYLIENFFIPTYLNPKIDELKSLIQSSVFADNNKMYSNANFTAIINNNITVGGGPMGGTMYGLKSFIQQRWNYISQALDCSGFNSIISRKNMRSVYPNPFRNELKIKQLKNEFDFIEIYNLLGEKIYKQQLNLFTILNLNFLENGIYTIKLSSKTTINKNPELISIIKI